MEALPQWLPKAPLMMSTQPMVKRHGLLVASPFSASPSSLPGDRTSSKR